MAYEVTATRRRPKNFDELAGQEFVAATLKNSLKTGHIAHAYLFSGPRGCGKTSAARILAKALRCEKGPAENPCGVCPQCLEIARGAGMDVIEIDGASNTGVNHIRQIKEEVMFPPGSGKYKIYIIDEVHMLSDSAFNALLKTIEEPPPYIIFIFATTELQKVPATIKSRCQQFNFRLIPTETIKALLAQACSETGITAEDEALFWIARESTGSARDAYTLFDQVVSFSKGHITSALIAEKLGLAGLDILNEFSEACAANDLAGVFSCIDKALESGIAAEQFVEDLADYYHSMLLIKAGVTKESILGYPVSRFPAKILEKLDTIRLAHAGELLYNLHRDIRYSVSPRYELETAASKLCWLDRWVSPPELTEAIRGVQTLLENPENRQTGENENARRSLAAANHEAAANSAESSTDVHEDANQDESRLSINRLYNQWQADKKKGSNDESEITVPNTAVPQSAAVGSVDPVKNPAVEAVLRIFDGTIVNGEKNEHQSF
ncbi:MAG: DNA polymerase III subunit gamma/tau [Treponema sp.]|nr:DNA polymerase III subunit gamma/tau [Treponema sp.]